MACLTPWANSEEFIQTAEQFGSNTIEGFRQVLRKINVWRTRVERLPTGVEVSQSLIEALVASQERPEATGISLMMVAAINRFLNLITQTCERKLGITKFHEAARKFKIPDWMISIRHETSHGGWVPQRQCLERGLAFLVDWINLNYWQDQQEFLLSCNDIVIDNSEYEKIRNLLECYGYLKIYHLWGSTQISDLRSQEELYQHIGQLWEDFHLNREKRKKKKRNSSSTNSLDDIRIQDAVNILQSELSLLVSNNSKSVRSDFEQNVVRALVEGELLIPEKEYLVSLLDDKEDLESATRKLPKTLVLIWSDILKVLAFLAPSLLLNLYDFSVHCKSSLEKHLALLWFAEVANSLVGSDKKRAFDMTTEMKERLNEVVVDILNKPSENLAGLLPLLSKLKTPNLSVKQENRLRKVIELVLDTSEPINDSDVLSHDEIFSLQDVLQSSNEIASDKNIWSEVDVLWKDFCFPTISESKLKDYHKSLEDTDEREIEGVAVCLGDEFVPKAEKINWHQLMNDEESIAPLYRNPGKKRKQF